jgi:hypothetical protein
MLAKRHRGAFNLENPGPYELSRSRIEAFLKCKACFWLQQKTKQKSLLENKCVLKLMDSVMSEETSENKEACAPL